MPQISNQQPQGPWWNSSRSVGPVEDFLGRMIEKVLSVVIVVFLGGALLIGVIATISWITGQLILPGIRGSFDFLLGFGVPAIDELILALLYGGIFGTVLGFLRYRLRLKKRLEMALDAFGSYETVSTAPFGLTHVLASAVAGAVAGAMACWLGVPMPRLLDGELKIVVTHLTPLVATIIGGSGSGAGGGEFNWISLIWLVLAAVILSLVACAVAYVGLTKLAYAVSAGAAGTVAKAFGVGLGLALARGVPWVRDPGPPRGPLTLENAIPAFLRWASDIPGARDQVEGYFRWSRGQGIGPLKSSEAKRYASIVSLPPYNAIKFLPDFLDWAANRNNLSPELNASDPPRPLPSRREVLDDLENEVFAKGWIARTITSGALAGAVLGGLQALISGILLFLFR